MTVETIFTWVEVLTGLSLAISSAEMLADPDQFKDSGWFSWKILRRPKKKLNQILSALRLRFLFDYPGVLGMVALRLAMGLALMGSFGMPRESGWFLAGAVLTTYYQTLRCGRTQNGADLMTSVVVTALWIGQLGATPAAKLFALLFIALHSMLAYGTAGFLKIQRRGWRDGRYVTELLSTNTFGHGRFYQIMTARPRWAVLLGYLVCYGDCGLAAAGFLPPPVCLFVLIYGLAFHLGLAWVMGLNNFVWSFLSTYPAIFYLSVLLYR